jgi:maleate cis-trans isomerase
MTYWIGRIEPSMWFEGAWWQEMLPSDVRLAVLSLGVGRLTPEELEKAHAQILEKVDVLEREGVDVINVGGSPVVTAYGMAGHARLLEEIGARVTRPYVTALQAELEGIRAVGATRVAVASPYPVAQTERRIGILRDEGFDVVAAESLDIERNREIAELDPSAVADLAVRVASSTEGVQAVYLPCGSLPVISVIEEIEDRAGLPVVACAQAQVAACLRRVAYPTPIFGFGRLLREFAAPVPA